MNSMQAKTALNRAIKPVAFVVYVEKKGDKPELEIGAVAKTKLKELGSSKTAVIEGHGVCRQADEFTAVFSAKKATPAAKTLINKLCGPSYKSVLFKEGADANADLNSADGADGSTESSDGSESSTAQASGRPVPPPRPTQTAMPQQPPPRQTAMPQIPPLPTQPPRPTQTTVPPPQQMPQRPPPPVPTPPTQTVPTGNAQPQPPRQPPPLKPGQDPALQPQMPNPPTLAWLRSFDAPKTPKKEMKKRFSKEKMKSIKDETDRGFFKGMGDFKTVFSGVEDLQASEQKVDDYIAAKGEAARPQLAAKLIEKYDALIQKIEKYQSNFDDTGTAVNFGRTKRSKGNSAVRDAKLGFSEEARQAALEARAQLQLPTEFAAMSALSQRATQGNLSLADEQSYHQTRADFLLKAAGKDGLAKASGGTSDTQLIRGFDGNVAYAFKSIEGESDQMGLPKGAGTAREVLTSRAAEVIKLQSDLDLGFPKTTLASLPMPNGTGGTVNRTGALITGLPGRPIAEISYEYTEAEWGKMDDAERADVEARCKADPTIGWSAGVEDTFYGMLLKKEQQALIAQVPAEAVQKILVMNFASASADSKWSNVMIDGTNAAPFDGGGCMMSAQELKEASKAKFDSGATGIKAGDVDPAFGTDMLEIPNGGGEHPAANVPLGADLVASIRKIDPDQLETEMKAETQRLRSLDGRMNSAVDDSGAAASAESTRRMKRALETAVTAASAQNRLPTTKEFVNAYNDEMRAWLTTVA